jgi:uncharacterized protein YdhG (YjbR/CyaY superfamily)
MKAKKAVPKSVDDYLAALSPAARIAMNQMRAAIRSSIPKDAREVISFCIPAFKWQKVTVLYAAYVDHYSLFPTAAVVAEFEDELKVYSVSKGTIRFPIDKPLPIGLIKNMMKFRVAVGETKKCSLSHR